MQTWHALFADETLTHKDVNCMFELMWKNEQDVMRTKECHSSVEIAILVIKPNYSKLH